MDRRLAWLVVAFGILVVAGGVLGWMKGSAASLASAGPIGTGILVAGLLCVRGHRYGPAAALSLCALTAVVMGVRLVQTGKLVPALPVGAMGLALVLAQVADRRRRALRRRGGPA